MAVIGNNIRFSDLVNSITSGLTYLAGNVGTTYKPSVPSALRLGFTYSYSITVDPNDAYGSTPTLTWYNRSDIGVVASSTLANNLQTFLSEQGLTEQAIGTATIGPDTVIKVLTAVYCFISARFAVISSPLSTQTAVFYIPSLSPTIDTTPIVDISPLPVTTANVVTIVNSVIGMACRNLRGLNALAGYNQSDS